jgi:hypothetical protein
VDRFLRQKSTNEFFALSGGYYLINREPILKSIVRIVITYSLVSFTYIFFYFVHRRAVVAVNAAIVALVSQESVGNQ